MATRNWTQTAGGTFSITDPNNWQFGILPGIADLATFGTMGDTLTGNIEVGGLSVAAGNWTLDGTVQTSGALATELTIANAAFLHIAQGAAVLGTGAISSSGTLEDSGTLSGSNLTVAANTSLLINYGATLSLSGSLTLNNGSFLEALTTTGEPASAVEYVAAPISISGTVNFQSNSSSLVLDLSGPISGTGTLLTYVNTTEIDGANSYSGGTTITFESTLDVSAGALPTSGTLTMQGGANLAEAAEFVSLGTQTIANPLVMSATNVIAAAHGKTLTMGTGAGWNWTESTGTALYFGAPGDDGVIGWGTPAGSSITGTGLSNVEIQAGTLRGIDNDLSFLLDDDLATIVDAGATLDINGFNTAVTALQGAGSIVDSGAAAFLSIFAGGTFSGTIGGPITLSVQGGTLTLSGANTYTGGTTIATGTTLQLGNGTNTGSITGNVSDSGALIVDDPAALTLNGQITGTGTVTQEGSGTTTLGKGTNSYSGGTTITGGTLAVVAGGLPGTGTLTMSGGQLLSLATQTIGNTRTLSGNVTLAAAHGTTLNGSAALNWTESTGTTLTFGSAGNDGIINFGVTGGSITSPGLSKFEVADGTLRAVDGTLTVVLDNDAATIIDAGATFDLNGFATTLTALEGAGSIVDGGAATTLGITSGGNFSGAISGAIALSLGTGQTLALTGTNTYTGNTTVGTGATLILGNGGPTGSVTGSIADSGTVDVRRSGSFALNVLTGTGNLVMEGPGTVTLNNADAFSGGILLGGGTLIGNALSIGSNAVTLLNGAPSTLEITGNGSLPGAISGFRAGDTIDLPTLTFNSYTYSGGVLTLKNNGTTVDTLTVSTPYPANLFTIAPDGTGGDEVQVYNLNELLTDAFQPARTSDVLLHNLVNGQTNDWVMSNGQVSQNLDIGSADPTQWQVAGTGDFNGDGTADLVLNNTLNGQANVWQMSNNQVSLNTMIGNADPTQWQFVGTGDFFGLGTADILLRNSANGQVNIWQMGNGHLVANLDLGNLDPTQWRIAGTGDFNGDATNDILLHNSADGQFNLWEMNNGQISQNLDIGAADPTQWQVAGTGDFYGNGTDDILLRNEVNGQVNIWEIDNGAIINNTDLGIIDPTQWQIVGTGDFNGDGTDDILLRNAVNGQINVWQMSNGLILHNTTIGSADPTQWQVQQSGVDLVTAPSGSATLDALAAHSVFDFSAGNFGNDTVVGFDDQQDTFLIGHTLAANYAAIQADEHAVSGGTMITFNANHSILVGGLTPSDLMPGNFHFV